MGPVGAPDAGARSAEARLDRLEALLGDLLDRLDAPAASAAGPGGPAERTADAASVGAGAATPATALAGDPFWGITALKEQLPPPGGVMYAGSVDVGLGHVEYQWGRPTDPLLRADWAERADRAAALGHPLRLSILQLLLEGEQTVAQLVDRLDLASTGVAYHHLNLLQGAEWATSPHRGSWTVPATRVVPLLAIITALEEG
nr:helix-turn-helix domain-containing protein [Brachybacterium equifaecis]